ncbi:hypothetical protein PAXRUDRAFT_258810 [Paxillus rubicundulus Ve08.2h10]|uniref:Uncharacterized protein n=1 Tax=Paxillus rubicundulus Ve08.2h10 TaxID=930991 RepID=A0A0D0DGI0_9AGAM|nr:hypothetical protein PAXRUDRAFT_258810 [Paxillus rubicundulus Ve08.2h10]
MLMFLSETRRRHRGLRYEHVAKRLGGTLQHERNSGWRKLVGVCIRCTVLTTHASKKDPRTQSQNRSTGPTIHPQVFPSPTIYEC